VTEHPRPAEAGSDQTLRAMDYLAYARGSQGKMGERRECRAKALKVDGGDGRGVCVELLAP
jgi:hypothetical protein